MRRSACSFENVIKNNIEYLSVFLKQSRGSVCMKLFYVSFHGAAVAKVLPTDVGSESLAACMLHQVSFQTVHRSEPATADLAVIRIETLVHIHMPSEAYPIGESLSTLTTMMSQISQSRQLVLIHPPGVRRHCVEHKQPSVRHLKASIRHPLASVRHLQA